MCLIIFLFISQIVSLDLGRSKIRKMPTVALGVDVAKPTSFSIFLIRFF